MSNYISNVVGRGAEILAGWARIDVKLAPDLVVIHLGRRFDAFDVGDHVQSRRLRDAIGVQRNGLQILDGLHLGFRILDGQEIVIPIARIDPQIGRDHLV